MDIDSSEATKPNGNDSKAQESTVNQTKDSRNNSDTDRLVRQEQGNQVNKQALEAKLNAASFAEIVSVLMRSPAHKHLSLSDLEWLVLPAVRTQQFRLAGAQNETGAPSAPIGLALWAHVSEEVDKKLSQNLDKPIRLRPDEWTSGNITWLIELVGEQRVSSAIFKHLQKTAFKNHPVKARGIDEKGKRFVNVFTFEPESPNATQD